MQRESDLFFACVSGNIELIQKLLSSPEVGINWRNGDGWTPLYVACWYGYLEIAKLLLNDERIDVNVADKYGLTPFFISCYHGHFDIVQYMFVSGKDVNFSVVDDEGKTSLEIARKRGSGEKQMWEKEKDFQKAKTNCPKIVELIEAFERDPNETRIKLKIQLGILGKQFFYFSSYFFR